MSSGRLQLQILGGCREQGRASFLLRDRDRAWLLDGGVKRIIQGGRVGEYPLWDELDCARLSAVILSHAHEDHCAALPLLYKRGFDGRVHCTAPTAALAVEYCHSWLRTVERYGAPAPYAPEDIGKIRFAPCRYGEQIDLGLRVVFLPAGHIVGSAMCRLEWEGRRFAYTGDVAFESRLLAEPQEIRDAEALIVDGSYGTRTLTREETEGRLLAIAAETAERRGSVLLPMPRFGRSQEMLLLLYEHRHQLPQVYVDAGIRQACEAYLAYGEWLAPGMAEQLESALRCPSFRFVETPAQQEDALQDAPAILLAPDAMLSSGPSVRYLEGLAGSSRHLVVLTGHQAPGTPGQQLLKGEREIRTARRTLPVRARIANVTVKVHPDYRENCFLIGENHPRIFIAHSEGKAVEDLEKAWREKGLDAIAPRVSSAHELAD